MTKADPQSLTPEALAKANFDRRKKAFLAEVDLLGAKYELLVHAVLEPQKATNPETKQESLVYVPKINIADRKKLASEAPEKPQEPKKKE